MKISVLICFALVLLLFLTIRGEKTSEEKTSEEKTSEEKTSEDKEEDNEKEHEEKTKEHEENPKVNQEKKKKEKKKKEKKFIPKRLDECGVNASLICESLNNCTESVTHLDEQIGSCSDNAGCHLNPEGCQNDYRRCIQSQNISEKLIKCHVNLTDISSNIENCLRKRNKTKWFEHVEVGFGYMGALFFDYSVDLQGALTRSGVSTSSVGVTCKPKENWSSLFRHLYQYFQGMAKTWTWPSTRVQKCGITGSNITAQLVECKNVTEINNNVKNCSRERDNCVRKIPCPSKASTCTVNTDECDAEKKKCMNNREVPASLIECGVNVTDINEKVKTCLWNSNTTKWTADVKTGLQVLAGEMHGSTLQHQSLFSVFDYLMDTLLEMSKSVSVMSTSTTV